MTTATIEPLAASLRRLGADEAARARLLFCEPLACAVRRWVPGLSLAPLDAVPAPAPLDEAPRFGLLLAGRGATLRLLLPQSIDAVAASILAAGAWSPAVRLACLFERAKSALVDLVQFLSTLGLQPVGLETAPPPLRAAAGTTLFEGRAGRHRIEGELHCTDLDWIAQRESAIMRWTTLRWATMLPGLAVPLRVRLGTRRIALGLLGSLEPGDVVLLGAAGRGASHPVRGQVLVGGLRPRGAAARACRLQDDRITVLGERWMNAETFTSDAPAAPAAAPAPGSQEASTADAMADIEIDLHFELQVVSTPLAELAAMKPGYVIELPMPAAEACVSLVAGGQVHGRAQLVAVGDRLGARILELFNVAQ